MNSNHSKRYEPEELNIHLHLKLNFMKKLAAEADLLEPETDLRAECARQMAVLLRVLLCKTSGTPGLFVQCGYDKRILFPLRSATEPMNLLPSYNLVSEKITSGKATLVKRDDIAKNDIVWTTMLSFQNWLCESVVDFKQGNIIPLSRSEVIRLVADKEGAHFDPVIDARLYKITHENVLPLTVLGGKYHCQNLYTETILAIADELLFAVDNYLDLVVKPTDTTRGYIYVQEYESKPLPVRKFACCLVRINVYNSNPDFKCEITERIGTVSLLEYRNKTFEIVVIE